MTAALFAKSSTESALQHNGADVVVYDQTGIISGADLGIKTIDATVASNAITVTFAAKQSLEFRSATLTSGAITQLSNASALSLVIAATDSFGAVTASGTQRLAILAINNAGTMELAAANLAGGASLDETDVITTALTATTATAIKAGAVRTGVAYRVVGFIDVPFTTAVGWGTIALKQGVGGQALAAMSSLGYGQTWQAPTRALATTYYNTTGKPKFISIWSTGTVAASSTSLTLTVNGVVVAVQGWIYGAGGIGAGPSVSSIVPPGASYSATTSQGTLGGWKELF